MAATKRKMHEYEPGSIEKWAAVRDPFSPDGLQGIGTSDLASALGRNSYKAPLDLWQEKVGLKEPFKGNEETERGKVSEEVTRARFAVDSRDWCRVEYHGTRYYVSDELPLYTTLDGEIIATDDKDLTCFDLRSGRLVTMHIRKGMHGILEIKDPKPKTEEGYLGWNAVPEMYRYQVAGQLRVTGFDFTLLMAHITGDYAEGGEEYRLYGCFPEELTGEFAEIDEMLPAFWEYVKTRKQPPLTIFDEGTLSLVEIKPEISMGSIWADLAAARINVIRYARQFEGLTFGDSELREAKKVRAELNKYKTSLNDMRIAIGKQWDAPLMEFKARVDELIGIVDKVAQPIAKQIRDAEEALDNAKRERIQKAIDNALSAYENREAIEAMGGVPFSDKWLNATKRMPDIEKEINAYLESVSSDLSALEKVSDDEQMHQSLLQEYYRTRSVNDALIAKDRIIAARKAAEDAEARKKQQAEEIRQRMAERWKKEDPAPPAPEEEKPAETKGEEIGITLRFFHTDPEAFRGLLEYMKQHGFTYEMVNG